MRFKILLSTLLFFFSLCSCQSTGSIEERMQKVLDNGIAEYQVHGVSATIIFPDNKIWTGVGGFSHDTISIKPEMVFGIGSITKNIMAALTLKLVEENRLALEDPISKWLPSFAFVDSTITIRQLLNHTSGLYMFWDNEEIWEELRRDREKFWSPEEVLQYIKEPYFAPGDGWRYSNTNYLLLGMIINKVTGSRLSDELKKHFWQPLGINDVYLSQEDSIPDSQAHVYGDNFQFGGTNIDVTFLPRTSHESIGYGSSGIFISSKNLARWSHALFDGKILKQQSMNEMLQFIEFEAFGNMRAYGLGTQVYDRKFTYGKKAIGHGGGNIGTSTYMVYLLEYHVSIVVMINAYPNEGIDVITKGLIQLVLKDLDALGTIPYFEFFPTGFFLLCIGVSVIIIITSIIIKRKRLIQT
jgi:D-alanyl-D-alanine carboxypeptidase